MLSIGKCTSVVPRGCVARGMASGNSAARPHVTVDLDSSAADDSPSLSGSRTQFRLVNQPPTMARLAVAPRVPVFVRQGCLVSLYNNNRAEDISLTKEFVDLWANIATYASLKPAQYVRLLSRNHSFNALISTNNALQRGLQTSLYHLNMGGQEDWQVWGRDAIVAFEANTSLSIDSARTLQFKKVQNAEFAVLRGRGNVLLNGVGSIVKVELKHSYDEILLNYRNLLAVSGRSQVDITDAMENRLMSQNKHTYKHVAIPPLRSTNDSQITLRSVLATTTAVAKVAAQWILRAVDVARYGTPTNFVKISGPRTVLIQSFNNAVLDSNASYELEPLLDDAPSRRYVPPSVTNDIRNSNLSIAYVQPSGRVTFEKTLSFEQRDADTDAQDQKL